jgi:two-component system, chemotaxis family, response regulator Rcp1
MDVVKTNLPDLSLRGMEGRRIPAGIEQDVGLKAVPTDVPTASGAGGDFEAVCRPRTNCCLIKPVEFDAFEDLVKSLGGFWLTMVSLRTRMRIG